MPGHRIGYVRVSNFDQNPERQVRVHRIWRGQRNNHRMTETTARATETDCPDSSPDPRGSLGCCLSSPSRIL